MPEDGPTPTDRRPVDVVRAGAAASTWRSPCAGSATSIDPPAFVQAEGGPHLNGALLDAGCVDELDLTVSPRPRRRRRAAARRPGAPPTLAASTSPTSPSTTSVPLRPLGARRRDVGRLSALGAELAEQLELAVEVGGGVEVLVDAGEAQVGDLVERAQPVEHGEADLGAGDLRALRGGRASSIASAICSIDAGVDRRPFVAARDAGDDLGPVERLACARRT